MGVVKLPQSDSGVTEGTVPDIYIDNHNCSLAAHVSIRQGRYMIVNYIGHDGMYK